MCYYFCRKSKGENLCQEKILHLNAQFAVKKTTSQTKIKKNIQTEWKPKNTAGNVKHIQCIRRKSKDLSLFFCLWSIFTTIEKAQIRSFV